MSGILVIGAGGHGKVVADILLARGLPVAGFLDDDPALVGAERLGLPVLGPIESWPAHAPAALSMALGDNHARQRVAGRLSLPAARWISAVHPTAVIAPSARLGSGVVIAARAVINPDAVVGDFAIVNTGATVDHDCELGAFCHVAPGVSLAGGVRVGEGTLIGVGASCIPYRAIGAWSVVGAGAVITRDIPGGVTAVGVPARWRTHTERH